MSEFKSPNIIPGGFVPEPLTFKYAECGEVFWLNPWTGEQERIFMMMWPAHPPEVTAQIEQWWETMGHVMTNQYNKAQQAFVEFHKIANELQTNPTDSDTTSVPIKLLKEIADFCNENGGLPESTTDGYTADKFSTFFVALYNILNPKPKVAQNALDEYRKVDQALESAGGV